MKLNSFCAAAVIAACIPAAAFGCPEHKTAVQRAQARGSLPALFSVADYPAAALRAGEQGRTAYRLDIGANGRVTGCTITKTSGSAALDNTTCRILRSRARFVPARDAEGKATVDTFEAATEWRLPQAAPAQL